MNDLIKKYGLIAAGVVAVIIILKKKDFIADVGAGAVRVATDAGKGIIVGIGEAVGIPRTDETECAKAKREGRTWDASFACGAGDWLGYVFSGSDAGDVQAGDAPTKEIITGNDQHGWKYYDDGTTIDNKGRYWKNGVLIWSPQ